jgi:hypothetical protein
MTLEKAAIGFWEGAFVVLAAGGTNQVALTIDMSPFGTGVSGSHHGIYFLVYIVPLRQSPIECDVGSIWGVHVCGASSGTWAITNQQAMVIPTDGFVDFFVSGQNLQVRIDAGSINMPVIVSARASLFMSTP